MQKEHYGNRAVIMPHRGNFRKINRYIFAIRPLRSLLFLFPLPEHFPLRGLCSGGAMFKKAGTEAVLRRQISRKFLTANHAVALERVRDGGCPYLRPFSGKKIRKGGSAASFCKISPIAASLRLCYSKRHIHRRQTC
jgi:hypothetical protein